MGYSENVLPPQSYLIWGDRSMLGHFVGESVVDIAVLLGVIIKIDKHRTQLDYYRKTLGTQSYIEPNRCQSDSGKSKHRFALERKELC